jgi:hypothetical protein
MTVLSAKFLDADRTWVQVTYEDRISTYPPGRVPEDLGVEIADYVAPATTDLDVF